MSATAPELGKRNVDGNCFLHFWAGLAMRALSRKTGTHRPGESKNAPNWTLGLVRGRTLKVVDETDNV